MSVGAEGAQLAPEAYFIPMCCISIAAEPALSGRSIGQSIHPRQQERGRGERLWRHEFCQHEDENPEQSPLAVRARFT